MRAVKAGLIAGEESEGAGFVGQVAKGQGEFGCRVELGESPVHARLTSNDFGVEQTGLDGPEPANAPARGGHLLDQIELGMGFGFVGFVIFGEQDLELDRVFVLQDEGAAAGESMAQRIAGCFGETGDGFGTSGFGAVGAGGFGFPGSGHRVPCFQFIGRLEEKWPAMAGD